MPRTQKATVTISIGYQCGSDKAQATFEIPDQDVRFAKDFYLELQNKMSKWMLNDVLEDVVVTRDTATRTSGQEE